MTERIDRYSNCELQVAEVGNNYSVQMRFSNPRFPNKAINVSTRLDDKNMLNFYEHLTAVIKSRADKLRDLSERYDTLLGLGKKVGCST